MLAEIINTERLTLTPLRIEDATELSVALNDPRLHEFIGGQPATEAELWDRHRDLLDGSGDPEEIWLNWTVRLDSAAIGTAQATVLPERAWVAWVIGVPWQGRGYAREAAVGLVAWLRAGGAPEVVAAVHPEHRASAAVAAAAGLAPTEEFEDGERLWLVRFTR